MVGEKWMGVDQYEGRRTSTVPGFSWGENQSMYNGWEWDTHRVAWNSRVRRRPRTRQPSQDQAASA